VTVGSFREPVDVTGVPGSPRTLAVVERAGRIRLVRRGLTLSRPLADLRDRVFAAGPDETTDQRGLFSVAFRTDYGRTGRFYVDYVDRGGRLRVDELRRSRAGVHHVLDLGPVTTMHHGGQLQFGPDGLLYVSTGMNDDPQVSQDPGRTGGKLLRLDPRAAHPRAQVYALGLRNPWRFSFDRATGALLLGDVGDSSEEEVDVLAPGAAPGANFGWPAREGDLVRDPAARGPFAAPALVHRHGAGWCAVTGGYVVRDRALGRLYGRYLYGDLCSGNLWSARLDGRALRGDRRLGTTVPYLVSFGQDDHGRLYAVSFSGAIYRLAAG
jgi:glucose/arabinose dehydrogenase